MYQRHSKKTLRLIKTATKMSIIYVHTTIDLAVSMNILKKSLEFLSFYFVNKIDQEYVIFLRLLVN